MLETLYDGKLLGVFDILVNQPGVSRRIVRASVTPNATLSDGTAISPVNCLFVFLVDSSVQGSAGDITSMFKTL